MNYKPHAYQQEGLDWLLERKSAALFLDMGLGKTAIGLDAISKIVAQEPSARFLVIAPKRVIETVWPAEIKKWDQFKHLTYSIVHGADKHAALRRKVNIYLINYEGLIWLCDQVHTPKFKGLIFDELSKMKSWSSKRLKAFKHYLHLFDIKWGFTGTPIPNGYYDIFAQIYCLDEGKLLGKYITHYRRDYFKESNRFHFSKPECIYPNLIQEKLKQIAYSIRAEDYIKLPSIVHVPIYLELPPELRAKYTELEDEYFLELEGHAILAPHTAALGQKLRQFLSGEVYVNMTDKERRFSRLPVRVHSLKTQALRDLIDELQGKKMLIGYNYQHELPRIQEELKGFQTGYMRNTKETADTITYWNAGLLDFLVGNPASIGHGLNLQEGGCNIACLFSLDYNLENYQQFLARIARQGQKESKVFAYYLLFKNTIDVAIYRAIAGKAKEQDELLNYLKAYRNERPSA